MTNKFKKKPVVIEAVQWKQMGDHIAVLQIPDDVLKRETESGVFASQRGFHPSVCGWIKTDEGGYIVAPNDWIITGVNGENYACKHDVFKKTYDVDDGQEGKGLPDIEIVSAMVHARWIQSKLQQGVRSRKSEDGEELMVDYDELSEKAKQLDRATVEAVYSALHALPDGE